MGGRSRFFIAGREGPDVQRRGLWPSLRAAESEAKGNLWSPDTQAGHNVCRESAPDFTTESTENTETDGKERRVRTRIRNPFLPASVASVLSVVKLRIAQLAGESREKRG
jgi:hypothetical protein